MSRIVIRSDGNGGATVIGNPPDDNGFFAFALSKVLSGKVSEISWEPIVSIRRANDEQ